MNHVFVATNIALFPLRNNNAQVAADHIRAITGGDPNVNVLVVQLEQGGVLRFVQKKPFFFVSFSQNGQVICKGGVFKDDNVQRKMRETINIDELEAGTTIFLVNFDGELFIAYIMPPELANPDVAGIGKAAWHSSLADHAGNGMKVVGGIAAILKAISAAKEGTGGQ
jgi:hypothetical protein